MKEVIIYSTSTCKYCDIAKNYFKANEIEFIEYNVGTDIEARKEMMDRSGQMGVPVIIIDNEIIVGFDKEKIEKLAK